jgi:hypothetical protein
MASCSGKSNFKFKLIHKVDAKDKRILRCESGTQVGTSDGKNRRSKIWRYCPFNYSIIARTNENNYTVVTVGYHCGGWSEEVNSCILIISYMVYL